MTRKRDLHLPDTTALEGAEADGRRFAPSAGRNIGPILSVLEAQAPASGNALEIASGTGQHIAAFARALPQLTWQPTDLAPQNLDSISAYRAAEQLENLRPPQLMDAAQPGWSGRHGPLDLVVTINLLHLISQTEAATVIAETARAVRPGGLWLLYGPFKRADGFASPGDSAFDARLRAQDPQIGYKTTPWVTQTLVDSGFATVDCLGLPANNLAFLARR